ncbi:uncharacterized protein LOC110822121, partial [Carica papaya]|uniref:uncharacterized protein LOC110822121 n=1 Tax=Carica papaya TaxID=3649 RepID=UPI000B8CBC29
SAVVATTRRHLPSDSGAFADWATSTSSAIRAAVPDDLSLGFNAGPTSAAAAGSATGPSAAAAGPWASSSSRPINYGLPHEMGMVGLRDVFVVAPASSFNHHHHHHHHQHHEQIMGSASDPINGPNGAAAATALGVGVGVGVIPLLTAAPCLAPPQNMEDADFLSNGRNKLGGIQLWQNQNSQYLKKPTAILDHGNNASMNLITGCGGGGGGGNSNSGGIGSGGGSGSSSGTPCQFCIFLTKKECTDKLFNFHGLKQTNQFNF